MYSCITCNYDTPNKSNLNAYNTSKRHLDKVNGVVKQPKEYQCKDCDYKTTKKYNLDKHINCRHNNLIRKRYQCLACNVYINDMRALTAHTTRCIGEI